MTEGGRISNQMRAFYTRTPRAGFYQSCPYTMAYHRDYVEIIWNLGPGAYGVVNLIVSARNEVTLFCNWKCYFDIFVNHPDRKGLLRQLEKPCPQLYKLLTEQLAGYCCVSVPIDGTSTGVAYRMWADTAQRIESIVAEERVLKASEDVINFSIQIYTEIVNHCPLQEWRNRMMVIF